MTVTAAYIFPAIIRAPAFIYFIPFFFVSNPALPLIGSPVEIVIVLVTVLAGILLVRAGLQGYPVGAGLYCWGRLASWGGLAWWAAAWHWRRQVAACWVSAIRRC